MNPMHDSAVLISVLLLAACSDKELPACMDGYGRAADGVCYPISTEDEGVIESVTIGPPEAGTYATLTSVVTLGGEVVDTGLVWAEYPVRYRWYVDGVESTGTANHLHGWKYFEKGQQVSLIVEPLDGDGPSVPSNTITIENTPPTAPSVSLYPENPFARVDSLRCDVGVSRDLDEDELTYKIDWSRDGEVWASMPLFHRLDDGGDPPSWDTGAEPPEPPPDPSEVPASIPKAGEQWTCTVSAYDGESWSETSSASVSVQGAFSGWDEQTYDLAGADYIFLGEEADDVAGASLSLVGDVDGDGRGDFAIPAYFNDEAAEDAGKVYLVRAADLDAGPGEYELGDMPFSFTGQTATEELGHATAPADDLDGDGLDDILICGYRNDDPVTDVGRVYVMLAASLDEPGTRSTADANMTFVGEATENRLGHSIGSAGDMDGDGLPELLIGAYGHASLGVNTGKTYIIPGHTLFDGMELTLGGDQYMFLGEAEEDASGHAVRTAWDVDGDGLDDMVVGARRNNTGAPEGGKGYLILGGNLGAVGEVRSLADADHAYYGEVEGGWVGYQATGAGDVDGDGLGDLLFGAHTSDMERGRAYLIYASSLGPTLESAENADVMFQGNMWSDQAGRSLAPAGDVDGDDRADILIGARNAGDRVGRAYLVFGASVGGGTFELGDSDMRFIGEERLDEAGYTVSSAGDVNGDGLSDMLIGAWEGDFDGVSAGTGRAYLLLAPSE